MSASADTSVRAAIEASLRRIGTGCAHGDPPGIVLAVSGGRDSMVLLHAAMASVPNAVRAVATFDHATGPHAAEAAALVETAGRALGVPVVRGVADRAGRTEAEWREARWRFLRACAREVDAAAIATAHTRDDQCETVVIRALRGSAARGLAALDAPTPMIVRPLVTVPRAAVVAYAAAMDVGWVDDPSNLDRRHLRIRVRTALLPAVERIAPGTTDRISAHGRAAAEHRSAVEHWVSRLCVTGPGSSSESAREPIVNESLRTGVWPSARVRVSAIARYDAGALALFWPAFAARAGVRLDRRAIARLVAYTPHAAERVRNGTVQRSRIPVAGAAGTVAHAVTLEHGPDGAAPSGRAWQFVVRGVAAPSAGVGMAGPRSSDYA